MRSQFRNFWFQLWKLMNAAAFCVRVVQQLSTSNLEPEWVSGYSRLLPGACRWVLTSWPWCVLCRPVDADGGGDVLNLVESDEEQIFQDTVPRLPPVSNGRSTTLVQIHRIPSSASSLLAVATPSHSHTLVNTPPFVSRWSWRFGDCGHEWRTAGGDDSDGRARRPHHILRYWGFVFKLLLFFFFLFFLL